MSDSEGSLQEKLGELTKRIEERSDECQKLSIEIDRLKLTERMWKDLAIANAYDKVLKECEMLDSNDTSFCKELQDELYMSNVLADLNEQLDIEDDLIDEEINKFKEAASGATSKTVEPETKEKEEEEKEEPKATKKRGSVFLTEYFEPQDSEEVSPELFPET